jgi:hypothetical protein
LFPALPVLLMLLMACFDYHLRDKMIRPNFVLITSFSFSIFLLITNFLTIKPNKTT